CRWARRWYQFRSTGASPRRPGAADWAGGFRIRKACSWNSPQAKLPHAGSGQYRSIDQGLEKRFGNVIVIAGDAVLPGAADGDLGPREAGAGPFERLRVGLGTAQS